jgi:hypothetical protein
MSSRPLISNTTSFLQRWRKNLYFNIKDQEAFEKDKTTGGFSPKSGLFTPVTCSPPQTGATVPLSVSSFVSHM